LGSAWVPVGFRLGSGWVPVGFRLGSGSGQVGSGRSHKNESTHKRAGGNLAAIKLHVLPNERHQLVAVGLRLPQSRMTVGPHKKTPRRPKDFE